MKTLLKQLTVAALALGFVAAAGAWRGPTQEPPAGNVAAPVNVSSAAQSKQGALGVGGLGVFGRAFVTPSSGYNPPANLQLGVNGAVGASAYCDAAGQNCRTVLGEAATSTSSSTAGAARAWVTFRNLNGEVSTVGESFGVESVASGRGHAGYFPADTVIELDEPLLDGSGYAVLVSPAINNGSGYYDGRVLDWVCIWNKKTSSSIAVRCAYPGYGAYGNSIASVLVFAL